MSVTKQCECGSFFETTEKRILDGRGKFCSQKCKYKYRVMPKKRDKYILVVENNGWLKKGERLSISTEFKKGEIPINYLGDNVGYHALHDWVERKLGKPLKCEHCGCENKRLEWANKSHEYKRDIDDWIRLCRKCHIKYDRSDNDKNWGIATKKFNISSKKRKTL